MSYNVVIIDKGKSARLKFTDNTIRVFGEGEYLVLGGNEFDRAKRDNVFKSTRDATNADFEALGLNQPRQEKNQELSKTEKAKS